MPKSIILFVWLACLAALARLAPTALDSGSGAVAVVYDTIMVALRLTVVWLIIGRRSNLLRWGWIGFAGVSAGVNVIHFTDHPGDLMTMPGLLLIAYYTLMVASAAALLVPASWDWFRGEKRARFA